MRWLIRSFITVVILIPFLIHVIKDQLNEGDPNFDRSGFLYELESWSYDTQMNLAMPKTSDDKIVILDIDEKSIASLGQWPWPRDKIAGIVDVLFDHYEIDVLGFDITFPEPDRAGDLELLDSITALSVEEGWDVPFDLQEMKRARERDRILAESFEGRNVVLGFVFDNLERESVGRLPEPLNSMSIVPDDLAIYEMTTFTGNLPVLQNSASTGGNFNPIGIDSDGKIRSVPLLMAYQGGIYESLALAMAHLAITSDDIDFYFDSSLDGSGPDESLILGLKVGDKKVPVGDFMKMLVPYRGEENTFKYISVIDVLNKEIDKATLQSTIAIVGTSAPGLKDIRVTPVSENFPGVEINANIISAIISGEFLHKPNYHAAVQIMGLIILSIILTIAFSLLPIVISTLIASALLIVSWIAYITLWKNGIVIPISSILSFIFSLFVAHLIYGSFIETRRKKQLSKLFGQYVPPELVDEMEADLSHYTMETKEAELTVMFADIKGFTTLSEALEAEQVSELLNEFLTTMTEVIHTKRGTIDKYMGDAIMAFWGAPLPDEEHAQHALEAAFLMQEKMKELNANLSQRGLPNIAICIGINTGTMSVGNMGSEFRMAYTVIGDSVNLASRLEALTRVYGVGIMLGQNTRRFLKEVICLELDKVVVKGKGEAVTVFEPLTTIAEMTADQTAMIEKHKQALRAYRDKNWSLAIRLFQELKEQHPDKHQFQLYLERIEAFLESPPEENWDGTFRFDSK